MCSSACSEGVVGNELSSQCEKPHLLGLFCNVERVYAAFSRPHYEHSSITEKVSCSCTRQARDFAGTPRSPNRARTKRSRVRLTKGSASANHVPNGSGSSATHLTRAQGPISIETSSPGAVSLLRHPLSS